MIWVRTPNSRTFESAYFVMRPQKTSVKMREGEMIGEAMRLLSEETGNAKPTDVRRFRHKAFCFLAGVLISSAIWLSAVLFLLR